ncbi:MAG: septum formation protein Maf [Thermoleophilia bacterium]|nr:MAG: septum formation protein Maf [Thermoleophilia bacterium]
MRLILASTSPQRHAILTSLAVDFEVVAPTYHEVPILGSPEQVVMERALGKALSVAAITPARPVLGVDTEVVIDDGDVLGQPATADQAHAMLSALSGREHRVISGIALLGEQQQVASAVTIVRLRNLSDDEIAAYVAEGEWQGRAGGYAIQELGADLVATVEGDTTNVVGLPVILLAELLATEGLSLPIVGGNPKTT